MGGVGDPVRPEPDADLLSFYSKASNGYKTTSVWAFNLWGVIGFQRGDVRARRPSSSTSPASPPSTSGAVGFVAGTAYVFWRAHRSINSGHDEARVLVVAAVMTSLLAFTLLTRMHERYLFPVIAGLAPLVLWRGFRRVYVVVSALFVLNLWYPFAVYNRSWGVATFQFGRVYGWVFGNIDTTDTWQKKMWSLFMVAACIALVARGFRWIERVDDDDECPRTDGATRRRAASRVDRSGRHRGRRERRDEARRPRPRRRARPTARPKWLRLLRAGIRPVADRASRSRTRRWLRLLPLGLVVVSCVFSLVILRQETTPANNLNDSSFHLEMVRWADHQIAEGRVPLDGWFPDLSLGSSFFHHYQSLPYTLTAYVARITPSALTTTYLWILYLMLALWPISVYLGARLLELGAMAGGARPRSSRRSSSASRDTATSTAATRGRASACTRSCSGCGCSRWRGASPGGPSREAASGTRPRPLVLALTIATHLMTGYLAVLCIGVWVLLARRGFVRRIGRAAVVSIGGLATAAWVLVPLLTDRNYSAQTEFYKGTIFNDSYGAGKILHWLFHGELFDHGRFPIFSLLLAVGFVVCVIRAPRSKPARAVLAVWTFSLLLFFGRATWGVRSVVNLLPGNGDLQMHRFMAGVDLAGIFLAGVGLVAVRAARRLSSSARGSARYRRRRAQPVVVWAAVVVAFVVVLAPAWTERARYDRTAAS